MDDVYYWWNTTRKKLLERKYKEQLKGGCTHPDIEILSNLNESEAHWEVTHFHVPKNGQEQKKMKENRQLKMIYLIEWLK